MDVENALRKVRRPVIDPENVWTYLPMILVYIVLLVALMIYRIGMSLHPWVAPGVVLLLIFGLVILAGAKVDDWWISNGGSVPTSILVEDKLKLAEKAQRTIELYTPAAIVTFWLAYSLFFHGGLEMLVPELISNAASLLVFLLVAVTNAPPLRKKMIVVVITAILIIGISLFVPGPSSLASMANIVVSLHKITAFSLLYLLTEISSKLRQAPLRNGYSSSHVRKWIQTAWILFAGRFVSLLGWVQIIWVIWILQRQLKRSAFINTRSQKRKVEDPSSAYITSNQQQQQQQQPITNPAVVMMEPNTNVAVVATLPLASVPRPPNAVGAAARRVYSNGIINNSSVPSSVGRIAPLSNNNHATNQAYSRPALSTQPLPQQQSWPPNVIHSQPPPSSSSSSNRGLSGRSRYVPRNTNTTASSSSTQASRKKTVNHHRRTIAKHGGSPLDSYSNLGGF